MVEFIEFSVFTIAGMLLAAAAMIIHNFIRYGTWHPYGD